MHREIQPFVHIIPQEKWVEEVAQAIRSVLVRRLSDREWVGLVLSGGNTPRPVYERLASASDLPWQRVHLFWGDERFVPHDDPRSNYGMVRDILIGHLPIPPENVHPMPTYMHSADLAAQAYEATLRAFYPGAWPAFDLVLLGLGADCHTASLFPHSPALQERERWVVAAPGVDVQRLTLTLPALNHARIIYFLARGQGKAQAVARVLHSWEDVTTCPARGIQPVDGEVHWWLDVEAASRLPADEIRYT